MARRIRRFVSINTDSEELERVQSAIEEVVESVSDIEINDGRLIKNVALKAGQNNEVSHGLGRAPEGWFLTRLRFQTIVWDTQDGNSNRDKTLRLRTSSDVTIDLWVF